MPPPSHRASLVARFAGPADIRPKLVDRAACLAPDFAGESGTPLAHAPHAVQIIRHQIRRDKIEFGVALEGEDWPAGRIGAAGPAFLTDAQAKLQPTYRPALLSGPGRCRV